MRSFFYILYMIMFILSVMDSGGEDRLKLSRIFKIML
jgi:hypothetical protein